MVKLTINGEQKSFDVRPDTPLLWALRDILGLSGTKFGCGIAQCGARVVHIDVKAVCIIHDADWRGSGVASRRSIASSKWNASLGPAGQFAVPSRLCECN
jgi:isoquinoline 1-oxidoreductase alpha subunit